MTTTTMQKKLTKSSTVSWINSTTRCQVSENCRTLGYKQEEEHVASIEKPRTSGTCGIFGGGAI